MGSNLNSIVKIASRASSMINSDAGAALLPKVLGVLATPLDPAYKAKLHQEVYATESNDLLEKPPPEKSPIAERILKSFSVGHAVSLLGVAMLGVQSKLPKSLKATFVDGIFKNVSLLMTLLGAPLGLWGRSVDAHKKLILGPELYGDYNLKQAQSKGFDIFTNYRPEQINDLINSSGRLARTLEYEDHVNPEIHSRHLKDMTEDASSKGNKAGGLFCGSPGTGKTAGVQLILGNWAKSMKGKGFEPVIVGLDLANFHKFLQETQREKDSVVELVNAGLAPDKKLFSTPVDNQGLTIFEVLISQIEKKSREVARHNRENPATKQKLFFVVDEFDKVLILKNLQGADKLKLRNSVLRLNEIFENQNILLTSNTPLKDMVSQLREIVGDEAVWRPFESRLNANHVSVDEPSTKVQARIFAGKILHDYPDAIDWQAFRITASGVFDVDKAALAEAIHTAILSPLSSTYTGRELNAVSLDVRPRLLDKALAERVLKRGLGMTDQAWARMTDLEKIAATKVKLTPDLLKDLLNTKHDLIKGKRDPNRLEAYSIIQSYLDVLSKDTALLEAAKGQNRDDIFSVLSAFYNKENALGQDVYRAKSSVVVADKSFNHRIIHEKADLHRHLDGDKIRIEFEQSELKSQTARSTFSFDVNEFSEYFRDRFSAILSSPVDKVLGGLAAKVDGFLGDIAKNAISGLLAPSSSPVPVPST